MAKRQPKHDNKYEQLMKRRALLLKIGWIFVIIVSVMFGYSHGYPIAIEGQLVKGILVGLAYGGGAFSAILISFFLNRKLRGL